MGYDARLKRAQDTIASLPEGFEKQKYVDYLDALQSSRARSEEIHQQNAQRLEEIRARKSAEPTEEVKPAVSESSAAKLDETLQAKTDALKANAAEATPKTKIGRAHV